MLDSSFLMAMLAYWLQHCFLRSRMQSASATAGSSDPAMRDHGQSPSSKSHWDIPAHKQPECPRPPSSRCDQLCSLTMALLLQLNKACRRASESASDTQQICHPDLRNCQEARPTFGKGDDVKARKSRKEYWKILPEKAFSEIVPFTALPKSAHRGT